MAELNRESAARARVGTTLHDKWHLDSLIAVGGMAAVYDGTHRNGMRGAVKILDPALGKLPDCRSRFLREGRLANQVRHAGAVRVIDDDVTEDGITYLVMELLQGSTLEALAEAAGGKLPAADVVAYGLQVVDTLAEAHRSGVVHRDIKPENLFLTNDGVIKVLDFGIATAITRETAVKVTRPGESFGTPAFMAPEQARGRWELVDQQSDLFALGASLFTLMTGALVHDSGGTIAEMLVLVITRDPPSLRERMPEAPDALVNAIDGALKLAKLERWANATTMRTALEEAYVALKGVPPPAVVPPTLVVPKTLERATLGFRRLPPRGWLIVAAAVLVAVCAGGVFAVTPRGGLAAASTEHVATREVAQVSTLPPVTVSVTANASAPAASASAPSPHPTTAPAAKPRRYDSSLFDRRY